MESNRALRILDAAAAGSYGVPAICAYNLEGVLAIVRAAESRRSPAMVLLFPWALSYAGSLLVRAAASACRAATVPITLHLDHAQAPEVVRQAADLTDAEGGPAFDSIMIDMSHYEKEDNLRLTRELTEYCLAKGIATEAEPGRIEGGEDGVKDTADLEAVLTTPEQALEFAETGIDWLAPAFGNVHGEYGPRGVRLEYDRLQNIKRALGPRGVRLVLHGSDTFTQEIFQRCIGCGITKINVNKVVNRQYRKVQSEAPDRTPITKVIEQGTIEMQAVIENLIDMLGSAERA